MLCASSFSFCASIYTENTSASSTFTRAPRMDVVMLIVVLTTLSPLLVRSLVMNLVASSTFMESSGRVMPWSAAKAVRLSHQPCIWVIYVGTLATSVVPASSKRGIRMKIMAKIMPKNSRNARVRQMGRFSFTRHSSGAFFSALSHSRSMAMSSRFIT